MSGFDLSTAQPVGFDLSTAKPVGGQSLDTDGQGNVIGKTRSPEAVANRSPAGSVLQNLAAGSGKYFIDTGRGVGQKLGLVSNQDVADSRERDAPLMATAAGKIGYGATALATTAPALAIPGANTIAGGAAIGAVSGAMQPSTSAGEAIGNIALGGAAGGVGQAVGNAVVKGANAILASRAAGAAAATTQNSVRDATLEAAQKLGYVTPPTLTNPSMVNTALESASGRYATKQAAMVKNQPVTNAAAATDLGLAPNTPITQQALQGVRAQAGKVYQQVKQTGTIQTDQPYLTKLTGITNASDDVAKAFPGATTPAADKIDTLVDSLLQDKFSAAQAVEYSKRLRQQASANFKLAGRSANPEDLALAHAQSQGADALEEMIGRHLEANGQPDLLKQYQDARQQIARTYTVDAALNDATGNVDAKVLARQLDAGRPLSGNLKTAARFAQAFGEVAGEPTKGPGVSKLAFASATGGALLGHPELAAIPVASTAARASLLTRPINKLLATPNYEPNALGTLALKAGQQAGKAALPLGRLAIATQTGQ